MKIVKHCIAILFIVLSISHATACSSTCTKKQFEEAESVNLKDWKSVYYYFDKYEKCDNADLSEMASVTITHMLADKWDTLDQFEDKFRKNGKFQFFILQHINEMADYDDIAQIEKLSKTSCNISDKKFCNDLHRQSAYIKKKMD